MPEGALLDHIEGPELIIGLVGAIGTNIGLIKDVLIEELKNLNYTSDEIRLSRLLPELPYYSKLSEIIDSAEEIRIDNLMNAGDDLRKKTKHGDALALLTIPVIRKIREEKTGNQNRTLKRHAFIINSIKQPEEIKTLRKIYGKAFILISIYAPRSERIDRLSEKISHSHYGFEKSKYRSIAEYLVEKDTISGSEEFGQNVRKAFPNGDFFVRQAEKETIRKDIKRFLEAWFRFPFHTPKKDEFGMFQAKAVSLRSADLSRQVGAVITSENGEILSVGCNEVPKANGGSVWEGEAYDYRDFQLGYDASAAMKQEIVAEMLNSLKENKWLSEERNQKSPDELVEDSLFGDNPCLEDTRVASLLEFGRIIHAEMAALMDSACRGISVRGSTLYCTTFPCHMCARHIIGAGIKRVVFIDPYPKSMAKDLYKRAISVDEDAADDSSVKFESFVGISPNRYIDFFSMPKRKDSKGNAIKWSKTKSYPILDSYIDGYYIDLEIKILEFLSGKEKEFGLDDSEKGTWEPKKEVRL